MEIDTQSDRSSIETNIDETSDKETWYAPLCKPTGFAKYFALLLFVALPCLGFWLGVEYGSGEQEVVDYSQITSDGKVSSNDTIIEVVEEIEWDTYNNPEQGLSFKYPTKLNLFESEEVVKLHHEIPFENTGDCDMVGDPNVTYPNLTDFGLSFELVSPKVEPSYIDGEFSAGELDGVLAYQGVEGCGQTNYYFDVASDTTLLVKRENIQALFTGVNTWEREAILAVPDVITSEENEEMFKEILASIETVDVSTEPILTSTEGLPSDNDEGCSADWSLKWNDMNGLYGGMNVALCGNDVSELQVRAPNVPSSHIYYGELSSSTEADIYKLAGNVVEAGVAKINRELLPDESLVSLIIEQGGELYFYEFPYNSMTPEVDSLHKVLLDVKEGVGWSDMKALPTLE